jgi:purine-binding chemotaxis protein CheW
VYGCDIDDIREIVPHRQATRLPGAPSYVIGLINLRGTIVTVLDLSCLIDATRPRVADDGSIMLVAMPGNNRLVGVAVQEVMDVRVVGSSHDDVIAHSAGNDAVRGLARVDGGTVILLDIHSLVRQVLLS